MSASPRITLRVLRFMRTVREGPGTIGRVVYAVDGVEHSDIRVLILPSGEKGLIIPSASAAAALAPALQHRLARRIVARVERDLRADGVAS